MEIKTEEKNKFCKLCFQYCDSNFEILKDKTNEMLELLLLKSDFNLGEEQIVCTICSSKIEMLFKFKSSCLNTENYIKSFTNSEGDSKLNLNDIYINRIDKDTVNLLDGAAVCRLCMKLEQYGCWASLNEEKNEESLKMLKQWLPELDFNLTEDAILCTSCQASLEDYFGFIKKCLDTKEESYWFKEKCDLDQNESKDSQFTLENDFMHEDDTEFKCQESGNINEIIFDKKILMDIEAQERDIKQAEIHIKSENVNLNRTNEAIARVNENSTKPKSKNSLFNCELCSYSTNTKTKLKMHTIVHQDVSTAVMYNCQNCSFTTKHKNSLRFHMKIHKDPSEVMKYQCKICKYETKYIASLKNHSLIHQSDLEATLYQCETCEFKTKHKSALKRHLFIHKYKYSCKMCSYKSNTQDDIDLHILVHNEAVPKLEVEVYSCEACPYKTRHKAMFNRHRITHSDVGAYECKVCGYKTTRKYNLSKHMLTHGSLKFRCEECEFQSNYKRDIEKHVLLHLPNAETEILHCAECKFVTKHKRSLKKHMVLHQKESSMKMYRCDICDFETKHKPYIKMHASIHQERKIYACDMCNYKAMSNNSLLKHKSKEHGAGENK